MKKILLLLGCIALPVLVGGLSGFLTSQSISNWYVYLNKPSFNPPNTIFAPVWTVLYVLMGISLCLIIQSPKRTFFSLSVFFIQLFLNFCWSFIFFYYHQIGWALVEIILLWLSIFVMLISFYRINKWAAIINVPYLLWVSFATILNYALYVLN